MRLMLLGCPGAGKGTQAQFISQAFHIPIISTGEMLRAAVNAGTDLGKEVQSIMQAGKLVPDDLIIDLVKNRIAQADCVNGFLLDGFPRTLVQAQSLEEQGIILDFVIEIAVDDEEIIRRISGRRVHPASGRVYHIEFNPPQTANKDDVTQEDLILREDDKEETIRHRLEVYHAQTKPLVKHYETLAREPQAKTHFARVNGEQAVELVRQEILKILTGLTV